MTIGGTRVAAGLAVSTVGAGGPALVFVHGFACAATDWRAQVTSFAAENTVVTVDLAGHGKNRAAAAECTIVDYGRCVSQALSELALAPAVLIGHSMGCRVVLEAARRRPETVAGLVLIDGSRIGEGDPVAARRAMADEIVGDGYQRFIRKFFGSMFVTSSDDELKRAITERALLFSPAIGRTLLVDLAGWDAEEAVNALAAVRVPLLAIQSTTMDSGHERSSLQPGRNSPWLDLIRAEVPTATIAELFGSGHFPQIEQAEEVSAAIARFVRRECAQ
jgi:pimeloyl-ACP methyl ester carboxylesterase